jgi:hypothetical protein
VRDDALIRAFNIYSLLIELHRVQGRTFTTGTTETSTGTEMQSNSIINHFPTTTTVFLLAQALNNMGHIFCILRYTSVYEQTMMSLEQCVFMNLSSAMTTTVSVHPNGDAEGDAVDDDFVIIAIDWSDVSNTNHMTLHEMRMNVLFWKFAVHSLSAFASAA